MNFALHIERGAYGDMRSARRWVEQHLSLAAAQRWQQRAATALRRLLIRPDLQPFAHEEQWLKAGLRQALFGRKPHIYRILFTIDGSLIRIHYVRHAARDWITDDDSE